MTWKAIHVIANANFYATNNAYIASYDNALCVTFMDWQSILGLDDKSISADPLHVNPWGADGMLGTADYDWHLRRTNGNWYTGTWLADGLNSPCIDAGDPADDVGDETIRNGGQTNLGAYGGTKQASKGCG